MLLNSLLEPTIQLAKQAGAKILSFYQHTNTAIKTKADNTPLTEADLCAHEIISNGLKQLTPDLPILSEESAAIAFSERKTWQRYWLIDPLDGTKEFLDRFDDFTVNIALIDNHQSVLGVLYAPALSVCYFACVDQGAFKQVGEQTATSIKVAAQQNSTLRVTASRRHNSTKLQTFLAQLKNYTVISRGSALKFALVAEGSVDIYPRLSPTSEWDTAAGQCIVEQAGGTVIDLQGNPLRYNAKASLLNPMFLAIGNNNKLVTIQ
jgi:3'(2'), 5'-bisphosphate nucleotidase